MMATDAELEGVINPDTNLASPGRYLILEHENGSIGLRKLSELGLKRIFREKKMDLANYTKRRTFEPRRYAKTIAPDSKRRSEYNTPQRKSPEKEKRDTIKESEIMNDQESNALYKWSLILAVLLALGALIVWSNAGRAKKS